MRKLKKIAIIISLLLMIFCIDNFVYAEESIEEKFKLIDECREFYEKELIEESGTWRGKKYTYANGYLSGHGDGDKNGKICYDGFWGNVGVEYNNYAKMQDYVQESVGEYFKQYLSSENEKEKLKGYYLGSQSIYTREYEYKEYDDIEARITVFFVPESNNSKWCENAKKAYTKLYHKENKEFVEIDGFSTSVYVRLVWEDNKYVVKFMDNKPEGYDEYVARMKEHGIDVENIDYPSLINAEENVQKEIQEAEKKEFETRQTAIGSINKVIIAVFFALILIILLINIFINKKNKRNL